MRNITDNYYNKYLKYKKKYLEYKKKYIIEDDFNFDEFDKYITIHDNMFEELNREIDIAETILILYLHLTLFYIKYKLFENEIMELNNDIDRYNSGDEDIYMEIHDKIIELSKLIKDKRIYEYIKTKDNIRNFIKTSKIDDYDQKVLEMKDTDLAKQYLILLKIVIDYDKNFKYENFIEYFDKYNKIYDFIKKSIFPLSTFGEIVLFNNHINIINNNLNKLNPLIDLDSRLLCNDIFTNFSFWFDLYEQTMKLVNLCVIKGNKILYYNNDNDKMIMTVKPVSNNGNIITEHLLIFRFPTVYLKKKYLGLNLKPIAYNFHKYALIKVNSDFMVSQPIESINPVFKIFEEKEELTEININDLPIDKKLFCLEPTKAYKVNKDKIHEKQIISYF